MRVALAAALLAEAGILIWVGVTRAVGGQPGAIFILASALLPLAACGLLFVRRGIGVGLAVVAALLGAVVGVGLSFCLCSAPLSSESIVILVASLAAFALALVELLTSGLAWVALAIAVAAFVVVFPGNWSILAAGVVVLVALVAWLILRRRRSDSGT